MKKFIKVISVQLLILLFILPNLVYPQALTPAMIEYYFDLEDFGYGSEFEAADIMKLPGGGRFAQNYYYDIFPGNLIRIIFEDAQKTAVYDTAGKKFIDDGGWKSAEYNPMTSTDIRVQLDSGNWTILKDDYTLLNEKGWNQIGSGRTYKDSEFISVQINNGNWTYYDIAGGSLIDEEGWSANNSFYGDYACVKLDNGNWTSINKKGELFDETGWMRCGNFINGLMLISTGGKELDYPGSWNYDENTRWNFIKEDKTFLCDTDFKYADHFQDGDDSPDYTRVQLENGRWNLIKSDGTFISETGFNDIDGYSREYAKIKLDSGRWTFLRLRDGLLINETGWTETDNYLDDDDLA
ncbi:MAG: hypothetical protein FWF08_09690, partial [Oscillospiraceae bacterium]|nr:hypothetical protein [Oscillospiraceae bacterium]